MQGLIDTWIVISIIVMFGGFFFACIGTNYYRSVIPDKSDRQAVRACILTALFGWLWPLGIPVLAGAIIWQGVKFIRDMFSIAFGRDTVDEIPVTQQQFVKPKGAELARQQEMSRKAHADRLARKAERREEMYRSKPNRETYDVYRLDEY